MARIKIIIPGNTITSIEIPVRITDINYGNHVGNDSLISLLHEARVQWLNQLGYSELDIEGSSIIMNELGVNYLNESFYGDVLNIQLSVGEISTAGFELYYSITTNRNNTTLTIAKAKTGIVFYDYSVKKISPIPAVFKSILLG